MWCLIIRTNWLPPSGAVSGGRGKSIQAEKKIGKEKARMKEEPLVYNIKHFLKYKTFISKKKKHSGQQWQKIHERKACKMATINYYEINILILWHKYMYAGDAILQY